MGNYRLLLPLLSCILSNCSPAGNTAATTTTAQNHNNLMYAVAWKQTAAEYRALYHQGFNLARLQVQQAIDSNTSGRRLAVISDLDETLWLAHDYWGFLIEQGRDFFDDASWDRWVSHNRVVASPGALEFLQFCETNGIEVFYVTNRDQGDQTFELALTHLQALGFPYADSNHLTVLRESSNKQPRQDEIRQQYEVVALLGDNLNDFSRSYYLTDIEQRQQLVSNDSGRFGVEYILFPNPTDGHWIRAIFGDSEPPANDTNREILREAATTTAWVP